MSLEKPKKLHTPYQDRSLVPISASVLLFHTVFIAWILFYSPEKPPKPAFVPKKLVVQTVHLSPQKIATADIIVPPKLIQPVPSIPQEPKKEPEPEPVQKKPEPKKEIPPEKPKPPEPKKAPPKEPPKKVEKKPAPPKKKEEPPKPKPKVEVKKPTEVDKAVLEQKKKQEEEAAAKKKLQSELLSKAQERIAKISTSRDKTTADRGKSVDLSSVPKGIVSLHVEDLNTPSGVSMSAHEISYRDEIAGRMKLMLRLPEVGDVKIKLTLDKSGNVVKVVIVNSESAANKTYVEKNVSTMSFPPFGSNFGNENQHTFSITLSNEL